jgi:antitoxin PrlF
MYSSALTVKGQVTIPMDIRNQLGLHPRDKIGFVIEDNHVVLYRKEKNIEAAFGICHPKVSASLQDIEDAIRNRGQHADS